MINNLKNLITGTEGMKVLQVVKGGILAYQDVPSFRYTIYDHSLGTWNQVCLGHKGAEYPVIFIKTTKDFIVGQTIDEVIKYTGKNITYTTYLGSTNTVMVFDSFSNDKKISIKEKQIEKNEQEIEEIEAHQREMENNVKKDFYFYK